MKITLRDKQKLIIQDAVSIQFRSGGGYDCLKDTVTKPSIRVQSSNKIDVDPEKVFARKYMEGSLKPFKHKDLIALFRAAAIKDFSPIKGFFRRACNLNRLYAHPRNGDACSIIEIEMANWEAQSMTLHLIDFEELEYKVI